MTYQFSPFGIVVVVLGVWLVGVSAQGDLRTMINWILLVILAGMLLFNWPKISPYFFKGGSANVQSP